MKEFGFGGTTGGTAREQYDSIVSNQVLPLLKPTFGTQFTGTEGKSLRATLGNINATPEAKVKALNAFMSQAERNIRTKASQLERTKGVQSVNQGQLKTISTKAEYDVLPSGTEYIDSVTGKKARKK